MAPIYDNDLREQRWENNQWQQVELFEQIQKRERRKRTLWIAFAVILFVAGASITVVKDRYVKWKSIRVARTLATQIQEMKTKSSQERTPYFIELVNDAEKGLFLQQYPVKTCKTHTGKEPKDQMMRFFLAPDLTFISAVQAEELSLLRVLSELCYDPLEGFVSVNSNAAELDTYGMAVGPANDLTIHRLDRFSTLLIDGESAEISFD
ncbi:MAG: hypothetical protein KA715_04025 [Xanthomonadaceae bacterium]|nr:hypothetical protein [Xanthomonadaceae bacterium]